MSARCVHVQTLLVCASLDNLHLREAYPFFVARRSGDTGDHHELDQLLCFQCQFASFCFFEAILGGGDVLACKRFEELLKLPCQRSPIVARVMSPTHHLQLVLPKFLLLGLVQKREVSHMVDEYVA